MKSAAGVVWSVQGFRLGTQQLDLLMNTFDHDASGVIVRSLAHTAAICRALLGVVAAAGVY